MAKANKYIPELNLEMVKSQVDACGLAGIVTILHIAKKLSWNAHFLTYQTSATVSKDTSRVVGYGAYAFFN